MMRWVITVIMSAILGLCVLLAGANLGVYRQPYLFLGMVFIFFVAGIMLRLLGFNNTKTSYEYEYIFTFKSGNTIKKKAYYKNFEAAVKTALKRTKKLSNPEKIQSLEVVWTGNSMTKM